MQYAHDRGVILRALSPATILVGDWGRLKLDGFDWARFGNDDLPIFLDPLHQMAVECHHFLSPESVLSSVEVDASADIYSLGCVFHFMLVGRAPYDGKTIAEVLRSHQAAEPPSRRELRESLPETILQLYATMMAKKPCQRLSIQQVIAVIDDFLTQN